MHSKNICTHFVGVSAVEWLGCLRNDLLASKVLAQDEIFFKTPDAKCSISGVLEYYVELARDSGFQGLDFEISLFDIP